MDSAGKAASSLSGQLISAQKQLKPRLRMVRWLLPSQGSRAPPAGGTLLPETCVTAEDPECRRSLVQKELQENVLSIFPTGKLSFIFVCVMKLAQHKIRLFEKKKLFYLRYAGSPLLQVGSIQSRCMGSGCSASSGFGAPAVGASVVVDCGRWHLPRPGIKPIPLHWQADS